MVNFSVTQDGLDEQVGVICQYVIVIELDKIRLFGLLTYAGFTHTWTGLFANNVFSFSYGLSYIVYL
jgi:hypothetical protein